MSNEDAKTFREWNQLGYRICRGAKACGFRAGEPLFRPSQTYLPTRRSYIYPGPGLDDNGCEHWEILGHTEY